MVEAKIHPPSRSRVAEARAAGIAPHPLLVGLAAALLALWSFQRSAAHVVWSQLGALLRDPLIALAAGDLAHAKEQVYARVVAVGLSLSKLGLLVMGCVTLSLLLAQGPQFAWPWRARRRFSQPGPSLVASVLLAIALIAWLVFRLLEAFWLEPSGVAGALSRWCAEWACIIAGLALIDVSFARARFFQALWLTRRELRDEQREAHGAPELRAARTQVRSDQAGSGART